MRFCANGFTWASRSVVPGLRHVLAEARATVSTSPSGRRYIYIMLWPIMDLWFKIPVESSFDSNLFVSSGAQTWTDEKARQWMANLFEGNSILHIREKNVVFFLRSLHRSISYRCIYSPGLFRYFLHSHIDIATGHQPNFRIFNQKKLFFRIRPKSFVPNHPLNDSKRIVTKPIQ